MSCSTAATFPCSGICKVRQTSQHLARTFAVLTSADDERAHPEPNPIHNCGDSHAVAQTLRASTAGWAHCRIPTRPLRTDPTPKCDPNGLPTGSHQWQSRPRTEQSTGTAHGTHQCQVCLSSPLTAPDPRPSPRYCEDEVLELPFGTPEEDGVAMLRLFCSPWQPQFAGFKTYKSDDVANHLWQASFL